MIPIIQKQPMDTMDSEEMKKSLYIPDSSPKVNGNRRGVMSIIRSMIVIILGIFLVGLLVPYIDAARLVVQVDNIYADMDLGGTVDIVFDNDKCYDPDDDLNGNGKIDNYENDTLKYSWDLNGNVDKDKDGISTNDKDLDQKSGKRTFSESGMFLITLTVINQQGETSSGNAYLTIGYNPIIKIGYEYDGNIVDSGEEVIFSANNSYDPDDDTNGNGKIDENEYNSLYFIWDFDDKTDTDMDGNYTNDTDSDDGVCMHRFGEERKYVVTLRIGYRTYEKYDDYYRYAIKYITKEINVEVGGGIYESGDVHDDENGSNGNMMIIGALILMIVFIILIILVIMIFIIKKMKNKSKTRNSEENILKTHCRYCDDTKKCATCGGDGFASDWKEECAECNGTGRCIHCHENFKCFNCGKDICYDRIFDGDVVICPFCGVEGNLEFEYDDKGK